MLFVPSYLSAPLSPILHQPQITSFFHVPKVIEIIGTCISICIVALVQQISGR